MIRINKIHIDKFKYFNNCYHYPLSKGIWLTFDNETLEYIGINFFYLPKVMGEYEKAGDKLINRLLYTGILEEVLDE